jgi:Ca-activated chloride channel family protein
VLVLIFGVVFFHPQNVSLMIEWMHPEYLWALIALLPIGLGVDYILRKKSRWLADQWPGDAFIADRLFRYRLLALWTLCGWAALLVAMAGPRSGRTAMEKEVEERQLIFLLDISRSMLADDINPDRITIAQRIAEEVSQRVPKDRVGLIAFAGEPYMILPLTRDHNSFSTFIRNTDPSSANIQGTEIAPALNLARRSMGDLDPSSVQCIILSDGENHESEAMEVAETMASKGVRIHTVGMGTLQGAKIPLPGRNGIRYLTDSKGQAVISQLQPDMLQSLAETGKGEYIPYEALYPTADRLSKEILSAEGKAQRLMQFSSYDYHYKYAAIFGLIALMVTLWILWDYRYV